MKGINFMGIIGKFLKPLVKKVFTLCKTEATKGVTNPVNTTAAKKAVIPVAAKVAKKIKTGMEPKQLRQFLGEVDIDEKAAERIAKQYGEMLPEGCRINFTRTDGKQIDILKSLAGSDISIPVSTINCNVTGTGNRLSFLDDLVNDISDYPAKYGLIK